MTLRLLAPCLRASLRDGQRRFELVADGLVVAAGEMVAVTGPSGSGKTLLLELIGLLRQPDAGARYWLEGRGPPASLADAWASPGRAGALARLRRELFGFVPQAGDLLGFVDVWRNAAIAQDLSGRVDRAYLSRLLEALGLAAKARSLPGTLSMGERQRVAIARALAHRPLAVIADEPTAALDPQLSREVMTLLLRLAAEQGTAVVVSTHDLPLVRALGLRRIRLSPEGQGRDAVVSRLAAPRGPDAALPNATLPDATPSPGAAA